MSDPMDDLECVKCGHVHAACAAHNRAGQPCGRQPSEFQRVCALHGSRSPQALRAAAERKAADVVVQTYDADPESILAAQGLEPIADPLGELGRLAASATHFMNALAARVNALESIRFTDAKGTEQLASEIALYERSIDRTARLLDLLVKSGFEERRLVVDERIAGVFVTLIGKVLGRVEDLSPAQRAAIQGVLVEELKALE